MTFSRVFFLGVEAMEPDYAFLMYWATWICRKEMPGWLFSVFWGIRNHTYIDLI